MIHLSGYKPFLRAESWYEPLPAVLDLFAKGPVRMHVSSYEPLQLPKGFYLLKQKTTPVIPLVGKTKDEVLGSFRDTTRNEVRRTFERSDITVACTGVLQEHYQLYCAHMREQGRKPQKLTAFKDLLVMEGRVGGALVSMVTFIPAQPIVKVFSISSARHAAEKELKAVIGFIGKRLVYELCVWGIEHGYSGVDLSYVNLQDPAKKGINDFKMGFGGELKEEYQYEFVTPLVQYSRRIRAMLGM